MRIEFLLAWEDRTWSTSVEEVPDRFDAPEFCDSEIEYWLEQEMADRDTTGLVAVKVYSICPQEPQENGR